MSKNVGLDEIRARAGCWTLQGDADMLESLVKISQDVIQKTESANKKTDSLCVELDRAACDLLNVSNSFTALANKQYVESRVGEEEPVIAREEKIDPPENTTERNKTAREEIVNNCLAFLDEFFEEVQIPADYEVGSGAKIILHPKPPPKPYRRLPYLIGTQEYEEDDYIGLKDPKSSSTVEPPSMQVDEHWESSSEGGLAISSEDASIGTQNSNQSSQKSSFLNELNSSVANNSVSLPQAEVRVSQPKIPPLISAYDQREPPPLFGVDDEEEAEDSIFGSGVKFESSSPSQAAKVFDNDGRSLFDDDDYDLFGAPNEQKPPQPTEKVSTKPVNRQSVDNVEIDKEPPKKKLPAGAVSLFGNKNILPHQRKSSSSSDSSSAEPAPSVQLPAPKKEAPPMTFAQKGGLFSDESDDDIFADPGSSKKSAVEKPISEPAPSVKNQNVDLFGVANDAAVYSPAKNENIKPVEKEQQGAVSKKSFLFGDSDSEDDIFTTGKAPSQNKSLFGDDSEDLFSTVKASKIVEQKQDTKVEPPVAVKPDAAESPKKPQITVKPKIAPEKNKSEIMPELSSSKIVSKGIDLFSSPETEAIPDELPSVEKTQVNKADIKNESLQRVKRRGLALNINPLALLPGSKPTKSSPSTLKSPSTPSTPVESPAFETPPEAPAPIESPITNLEPELVSPEVASFDTAPPSTSQLLHLGKDRIRIKQKRKPPSRRNNSANIDQSASNLVSPTTDEEDLFVVSPVENLFEADTSHKNKDEPVKHELGPSSIFNEPPPLPSTIDDIFGDDDDLFSEPFPVAKGSKEDASFNFEPPPLPSDNLSAKVHDLFAEPSSTAEIISPSNNSLFADSISPLKEKDNEGYFSNEDIFGTPSNVQPVSIPEVQTDGNIILSQASSPPKVLQEHIKEPKSKVDNAAEIFKDVKQSKPEPELITQTAAPVEVDIFGADSDESPVEKDIFDSDADIFSPKVASASSDLLFESPKAEPDKSSSNDIFHSFGSEQDVKAPPSESGAPPPAKSEEAFFDAASDDDDDFLFGASSKNYAPQPVIKKEIKKKSPEPPGFFATQSKQEVHDIFAEDDDNVDLFGTPTVPKTSTSTPQATLEKKSVAAPKFSPDNADLFGDGPVAKKKVFPKKKQSNLFFGGLDEEEDELFGSSAHPKQVSKSTQPKSSPKPSKNQDFDDPLLGGGF